MPPADMPPGKRQRTEEQLSEEEFAARHGSSGVYKVQVPKDDSKPEWQLNGQVLSITMELMDTVKSLKQKISDQLGIPAGSQKLKQDVFLKDGWSMAKHNVVPGSMIEM